MVNCIGDKMVSVCVNRTVDRRFEPKSGQTKTINLVFPSIGICYFS